MDSWLERTYALQVECFGGNPAELSADEKVDFVRRMTLGLIVEATEALNVVSHWKWWHDDRGELFDKDQHRGVGRHHAFRGRDGLHDRH